MKGGNYILGNQDDSFLKVMSLNWKYPKHELLKKSKQSVFPHALLVIVKIGLQFL